MIYYKHIKQFLIISGFFLFTACEAPSAYVHLDEEFDRESEFFLKGIASRDIVKVCYRKNGVLGAIIYEVHNTFKERHCYVLAVNNVPKSIIKQHCNKQFYVSPFIDDACKYNFRIQAPGKKVSVVIREEDEEGLLLAASFAGVKVPLTDKNLIQTVLNYPLMTIKVIIGIHYEAIKLIFKRVPMFTHTPHAQKSMHSVNTLTPLRKQK